MQNPAPAMTEFRTDLRSTPVSQFRQFFIIALTAFLTVVDLFAAQAILPSLTVRYHVTPAQMAVAVNASTLGMAISSLLVAIFSTSIDRRRGILISLLILAIPTACLAHANNLAVFFGLRVVQGLLMASAFGLTLAYLGERMSGAHSANAFAAYITGNVASNLIGRFIAASVTDHLGLAATFYCLAALKLCGALLVYLTVEGMPAMSSMDGASALSPLRRLSGHFANRNLRLTFGIGFLILFAFIGTFSFVNFELMRPPFSISMTGIGAVYLVFLPSILTTAFAGHVVARTGARRTLLLSLGVAALGLPLLLLPSLATVLAGMTLVAAGTFFAQATATGFTSRAAHTDRGAASGLYLASYFLGGISGAAILGRIYDAFGWTTCVAGIALSLLAAGLLAAWQDLNRNAPSNPHEDSHAVP